MLFLVAGCTTECVGPACIDAWPAARLLVGDGERWADRATSGAVTRVASGSLNDGAGWVVLHDGDQLVIGQPERGRVLWTAVPDGPVALEDLADRWIDVPDEGFGSSLALADLDGDGRAELWVGAPLADRSRGAVYRIPPDATVPDLRILGDTQGDRLGADVHGCGDVTGDGRADLVVVAPWLTAPADATWPGLDQVPLQPLAGGVFLIASEAVLVDEQRPGEAGVVWWGDSTGAAAGRAVDCRGDLDDDGLADVVIGAPFAGEDGLGRVFIRPGRSLSPGGLRGVDAYSLLPTPDDGGRFGSAVVSVDGGVLVGAPGAQRGAGRVTWFPSILRFPGASQVAARLDNPRAAADHFGAALAVGDVDGDGAWDLAVGAPDRRADGTEASRIGYDAGAVGVFRGSGRAAWSEGGVFPEPYLVGVQSFERLGDHPVLIDVDGDGREEVLLVTRAPDPG